MADRKVTTRELNQNAGRVVRSVATSGPVDITYHGEVIARIVPVDGELNSWERLLRNGQVELATQRGEPLPKPIKAPDGRTVAEMVDETRGDH
ncbi:MAG: type II toxin-antitoxin system prevent-host-death family antitoxin [Acidimicrobiia bacterium]|nr:type II toxin-antitoxin system prevent-host-death family antitoxin [Acidimicrobiia bacterium]